MTCSQSSTPPQTSGRLSRAAWFPIPLLLVLIAGLWVADLQGVYESCLLMVLLNLFFTWLASLLVCVLTARAFLVSGQPVLLMFGCGALLWGVTSLAAAVIIDQVNATITVHNVGVLGASLCHVAGMLWRGRMARPGRLLVAGYAGALLFAAGLLWAAVAGLLPLFFVQGQGGTPLRHAVLLLSIIQFAWVAWHMLFTLQRQRESSFFYWYGLGLALVATGLVGVSLLSVQGGVLGWTNRLTQYLGSAYLVVAALLATRASGRGALLLTGAGEAVQIFARMSAASSAPVRKGLQHYALTAGAVVASFAVWLATRDLLGMGLPPFITFYPVIMLAALLAGFGPGLFATALTVAVVSYWIMPPFGHFSVDTPADRLSLVLFFGIGVLISTFAELYRRNRSKAAAYDRDAALRESAERFRALAEEMPHFVWETDSRGETTYQNARWHTYTGLTHEQSGHGGWLAVQHPEDAPRTAAAWAQALAFGADFDTQCRFRRASDGQYRWFRVRGAPVRDDSGAITRWVGTCTDIHDQRTSEESLSQLSAELEARVAVQTVEIRQANETLEARVVARTAELEAASEKLRTSRLAALGLIEDAVAARREAERNAEEVGRSEALLQLVAVSTDIHPFVREALTFFQALTGCEAVGLRLRDGEDFPYFETRGFPSEFVQLESRLCTCDAAGQPVRDSEGQPLMECMCGNIICGRFNPALPFFSEHGSFWTNSTTDLLASTTPAERQARTRNRCNGEGYESVALLPLMVGTERLGLLQLNDRRRDRFNAESIAFWERLTDHLSIGLAKLRAEMTLRESEERYRSLFSTMLEGFCVIEMIFDADRRPVDYRFLEINPAFEAQTGLRNVQGKRIRELAPGNEDFWYERYGQVALTGEPVRFESEAKALNRWFDVGAYRVGGPGSFKVAILFNDITHRKHAEDALRESEKSVRRKLASVFTPEGDFGVLELADLLDTTAMQQLMDDFYPLVGTPMAIVDLKGRVLVKAGWQDICMCFHRAHADSGRHCIESDVELSSGLSSGEHRIYKCKNNLWDMATPIFVADQHVGNIFIGQFFFEGETPEVEQFRTQARLYGYDEAKYLAALERVPRLKRETVEYSMAFFLKLADMIAQLGFSNVKLARLLAERDRLTETLRESESFYRQTLESVPGMTFTTRPDGYCDYQSQQWVDYTGVPMSEHVGDGWNKLLHPDDRPRAYEAWCAAVEGRAPYDLEYRVRNHEGSYEWFKVRARPIRDSEGTIVRWFGTAINIDSLIQAQTEVRHLNEQLEQRVRERTAELESSNRELESFCYSVSHDLRTPLRTIDGFSQATLEDYGERLDGTGKDYLNRVRNGCRHMDQLIDDLLRLSRVTRDQMRRESVDLTTLALAAARQLQEREPERHVDIRIAPGLTAIGDTRLLHAALFNLLANAWKFTSKNLAPVIEVGRVDGGQGSGFRVQETGENAPCARPHDTPVFFVRDNGVGFDMQYASKLFNAFQRLHSTKEFSGIGIGLATVARVIQRHGGRIWAEAAIDRGATFYFTLEPGVENT